MLNRMSSIGQALILGVAVTSLALSGCTKKKKDEAKGAKSDLGAKAAVMSAGMRPATRPAARRKAPARRVAVMGTKAPVVRPAAPAAGKAHTINFLRPMTVGQKMKTVVSGRQNNALAVDGKVIPEESSNFTFKYEGVYTVKAVNAKGKPTQVAHVVTKLEITEKGATKQLLPKGATFLATKKGDGEEFVVDGKPATGKLKDVLDEVVSLDDGKDSNPELAFVPKTPKRVGETWGVDVPKLLKGFLDGGPFAKGKLKPTAKDIKGSMTLLSAKPAQGIPALQLKATMAINNLAPEMGPMTPTKGNLTLTMQGWIPQAPKLLANGGTMTMHMHIEAKGEKAGKPFTMVMDVRGTQTSVETPVK